jgi:hypothetical protein
MTTITKLEKVNRTEKTETAVLNKISFEANESTSNNFMLNGSKELKFKERKPNGNIGFAFQSFNKLKCAIIAMFLFCGCLYGQYENIVVPAGTKIIDNFPPAMRYLYPQFVQGQIVLRNNQSSACMINYNMLQDEMEFISGNDTLTFIKKRDLKYIIADNDTFTYNSGYVKHICGQELKVYCKDKINFKDVLKRGAMGTVSRTAAIESIGSMDANNVSCNLVSSEDMVFRREVSYYITTSSGTLEQLKKQSILRIFSNNKADVQRYLKANKINFQKQEDIIKLAGYLSAL